MRNGLVIRLYAVLLLIALVWVLLGAPLLENEWQDVPHRLQMMLVQLPGRMGSVLSLWR